MMKQLLSRDNLISALKRVEKNKGKHGVDEMPVKSLRAHLLLNWDEIRNSIKDGTYEPMPVRRVEIPKPNGGIRLLGIPSQWKSALRRSINISLDGVDILPWRIRQLPLNGLMNH